MRIEVVTVSPFVQNARILVCEKTNEALLVDPGDDADTLERKIKDLGITVKYMLATHGHIDHVGAVACLQERLSLPFYIHPGDMEVLKSVPRQAALFGMPAGRVPRVDHHLEDGMELRFGQHVGKVIHTPGHSPGCVCFLFGDDLLAGDTLFAGSVGRTDLPGGSFPKLQKSILERLYTLPLETRVHPGHGPSTTIGHEKRHNPFVHE